MNKIILTTFLLFGTCYITAQKQSGQIIYKIANIDFVDKGLNVDVTATNAAIRNQLYQLSFNKNYSTFTLKNRMQDENSSEFHNILAKIMVSQYDYCIDFKNSLLFEIASDGTLIEKKLKKLEWILTSESKMIDQYLSYKATYVFEYLARDNKLKSRIITAWFAPSLPYSYGPKDYFGLPGLILELTEGDHTFLATEINLLDSVLEIKAPKGKTITKDEYEKAVLKN